ncbi:MAG: HAMP domain-containing histidine kinase [Verrucomicrobia bacterium]|nr:HAMP domain-containing histidine kinase [Verrucomicrobiota bacterium]
MRIPRRFRPLVLWIGFAVATVATAIATYRLYQTAQQEITVQSEQALQQARLEVLEGMRTYTEQVRRTTIKDLASFHVDGLSQMMKRWDDANETIIGTFQWDKQRGFWANSTVAALSLKDQDVTQLWQEFRKWRSAHPAASKCDEGEISPFRISVYPTRSNPSLPEPELGYQSENLDILQHAGRPVDPWAGWAALDNNPDAPWVFWYQAGPDDTIRGCLVDVKLVVKQLRIAKSDTRYARYQIVAAPANGSHESASTITDPLAELPSYLLTMDYGDLFKSKASNARITATIAASLFGIFVLGGIGLTIYTRRELRDAERKTNFVAQVSHELRTPLTSIHMYADLLGQPELAEAKRVKFATTIARESTRLETMVERLLAFNAVERNSTKVTCTTVEAVALVHEAVEETRGKLQSANLAVEVLPAEKTVFTQTDSSILKQALLNLLDNAAKYAREGGKLHIRLTQTPDQAQIDVIDFGPGIPRSIRHRLFEPFVQGNQTLTNKSPGVGLGLSLARGTLRQVGADLVLLESDQGAIFQIRLPLAPHLSVTKV